MKQFGKIWLEVLCWAAVLHLLSHFLGFQNTALAFMAALLAYSRPK